MLLLTDCFEALQFPGSSNCPTFYRNFLIACCINSAIGCIDFWKSTDDPTLKKFLDFRLSAGNLEDEETEHNRYKAELSRINITLNHLNLGKNYEGGLKLSRQVHSFHYWITSEQPLQPEYTDYPAGFVLAAGKASCLLVGHCSTDPKTQVLDRGCVMASGNLSTLTTLQASCLQRERLRACWWDIAQRIQRPKCLTVVGLYSDTCRSSYQIDSVGNQINLLLFSFHKDSKNSKTIQSFWEIYAKKENALMKSKLREEKVKTRALAAETEAITKVRELQSEQLITVRSEMTEQMKLYAASATKTTKLLLDQSIGTKEKGLLDFEKTGFRPRTPEGRYLNDETREDFQIASLNNRADQKAGIYADTDETSYSNPIFTTPPKRKLNPYVEPGDDDIRSIYFPTSASTDSTYAPPSSVNSLSSDDSPLAKKSFYIDYFVGPGELVWELKQDSVRWIVGEVDISVICMEFRSAAIQKCELVGFDVSADEELALSYIFLFQEENPEGLREQFDDELWSGLFAEIRTQYPYLTIPDGVFEICERVARVACQQQDPRQRKADAKRYLKDTKAKGELEEIMHTILSNLADNYQNPFIKNNHIEDTHVHNNIAPLIKPFFPEGRKTIGE
ncbi:LOW QUALITY PROTEIN: hypothetical protein BC936DRAFT_144299 [Jimgerdemannia flammicorona]|uniref:Uncharacterized protein n=1 Tax=Jimgerdemannia flammicorona TaxID=994334 RepID=A0A433DCR7_9FUNG|nr:LOW QUALITY PROTEIN: hypothetical protein BC936DRAFT_144299 [Jimgerdemannia flammicorona]